MLRAGETGGRGWGTRQEQKRQRDSSRAAAGFGMTNSGGWTAEVGDWKSEITDRRLENRGWRAGRTEERPQITVTQHA